MSIVVSELLLTGIAPPVHEWF